ncbi:glycosyltransferase family 2 protein [Flagellimonas meridianipacifica]|uniref:Glycosyltransferase involved in cell wall biosynthesis n=1 Tax=Flagellimonas meridianipacifica TaxID=1080225 RepID=A0A2T0M9F8_9FLAO|nr:glycosyltransferase family 2 protein [Allomuricauda pacifica]PRX54109.1 glycosyltransferase involved in cell wall biosynthesis [Allomuricauda pacifica]
MATLANSKLSALVITYNEIGYIERCLESISFADEILVVDSYSTDGTYEYLLKHPKVKVLQHPFENFTAQKSYALSQSTHDWTLFVDADEVVTPALRKEIQQTIRKPNACEAYWFYRKFMFKNQPLRFSGWQTDKNHRLFRKSKAKYTDKKIVHETLEVDGKSGILKNRLTHYCFKNYQDYKGKMLRYGGLRAQEEFLKGKSFNYFKLWAKPTWRFLYNYIVRLGVLDMERGVQICWLNALSVHERYRMLHIMKTRTVYQTKTLPNFNQKTKSINTKPNKKVSLLAS